MAGITFEQYLRESAVKKETLDRFLDPNAMTWAQFDPICGYRLKKSMPRDGIDNSYTISTCQENSARTAFVYTHRPKRINAYGNSFTQCHQVSDAETWTEYLAGHLGEPIGNFGMGGYGVYQSYRRMLRTEAGPEGGEYVMLYIWGDDHLRSIMRCRHALIYKWWDNSGDLFHNPFWANVEMDLHAGTLVEHENRLGTPNDLYKMTDPDFMYEALKDDLITQLMLYHHHGVDGLERSKLARLAEILAVPSPALDGSGSSRSSMENLINSYGFAATRMIVDKAADWAKGAGKKIMFITFCPGVTRELITQGTRYDQPIADFLNQSGHRWFDMNPVHVEDFKAFKIPLDEYLQRYFIGHYSPAGNHFFAFSIKKHVVEWLNPKPITYREGTDRVIDFKGYLKDDQRVDAN